MKKLYAALLFIFCYSVCSAQYIAIPDTAFVRWLQTNSVLSGCMNGNQLDTTCPAVAAKRTINISSVNGGGNIGNLEGIQYFRNMDSLICSGDEEIDQEIPNLPKLQYLVCNSTWLGLGVLPPALVYLNCSSCNMAGLPPLPSTLKYLICDDNTIQYLPALPASLIYLDCDANQLENLNGLPTGLRYLNCSYNYNSDLFSGLAELPSLPPALDTLICEALPATSLPSLPVTLKYLDCYYNLKLDSLPPLPSTLLYLDCSMDASLKHLSTLPANLRYLDCSECSFNGGKFTSLPAILPAPLQYLNCSSNSITVLPSLPDSLIELLCNENELTVLPGLPPLLTYLNCGNNSITSLPALPPGLTNLLCSYDNLTTLPTLPLSLQFLECNNNNISSLPPLPPTMTQLWVDYNSNLSCLPAIQTITSYNSNDFNIGFTNIKCLPNRILHPHIATLYPADTMALCGIFNPTGCEVAWNITGSVLFDTTGNCDTTITERGLGNIKVSLYDNTGVNLLQQVITNPSGTFSFKTGRGKYKVSVDTAGTPFNVLCPSGNVHSSNLTPADSLDYYSNFRLLCRNGYDLGVTSINYSNGSFFPGQSVVVHISAGDLATYYGVDCNTVGVAGIVQAIFTGPVKYIRSAGGMLPTAVNGDTVTWNVSDFSMIDFNNSFAFVLGTDTTAVALDTVCIYSAISSSGTDYNLSNNSLTQCFGVVTSHDPNYKEVYPGGMVNPGDWLMYTIHFQNTGNAPAHNIHVLDTIDPNLDLSTIQVVEESNPALVQVLPGRVVSFSFPNIFLPDSSLYPDSSTAFVQFKIRTQSSVKNGGSVSNKASIYFDFNAPVQTNTVMNPLNVATGINQRTSYDGQLIIFPNPTSEQFEILNLKSGIKKIEVYNVLGEMILSNTKEQKSNIEINLSGQPAGIYFIRVTGNDGSVQTGKVVKE